MKITRLLIGCQAIDPMAHYSETQTVGKMPCLTDSLFVQQPVVPKKRPLLRTPIVLKINILPGVHLFPEYLGIYGCAGKDKVR